MFFSLNPPGVVACLFLLYESGERVHGHDLAALKNHVPCVTHNLRSLSNCFIEPDTLGDGTVCYLMSCRNRGRYAILLSVIVY